MNIQLPFRQLSRIKFYLIPALVTLCLFVSSNSIAAPRQSDIEKQIKAIEKNSKAIIGITAIHIEKNKVIRHNGAQRFFMASTIKLPIAVAFLHRVDQGKESLKRIIKLNTKHSVPGSGALFYMFEKKELRMSLQQILKCMMINSDNSASDVILQAVKGPTAVTQFMSSLGFKNIQTSRSILQMLMYTNHVDPSLSRTPRTVSSWKKEFNHIPLKQKAMAWRKFQSDIRDTTTSDDMAKLLVKIQKGEALSESSTELLLNIMERCRTGRSRIRGLLPAKVKVAHKTGTWGIDEINYIRYSGSKDLYRFTSDVGIITLPNNKGHVAIAIYVKSKSVSDYSRSRAIALMSKAVYDYFMKS